MKIYEVLNELPLALKVIVFTIYDPITYQEVIFVGVDPWKIRHVDGKFESELHAT